MITYDDSKYKVKMSEILMGRAKFEELPEDIQSNLVELLHKINKVREAYGKPMRVNSGLRRPQDQPKNAASKSNHLIGAAVDIDDDDAGTLWKWVKENLQLMKDVGLWMEDPRWTHGAGSWMHFQITPPRSKKRIYVPSVLPPSDREIWDGHYDGIYD